MSQNVSPTDDDAFHVKVGQNGIRTPNGLCVECPNCEREHPLNELLEIGCSQTGWQPPCIAVHPAEQRNKRI